MKSILFGLMLLLGINSYAACNQFYPNGKKISVPNSVELCNSFFVTVYSYDLRATLFSSSLNTPSAARAERSNDFRPDRRLGKSYQAQNSDYAKSGFDRGHLVPAADAKTDEQMRDTFLLSNMTPQEPTVNRVSWKELEEMVRKNLNEPTVVLTGAIYSDAKDKVKSSKTIGKNAIPVPLGYFKIIYAKDKVRGFYAPNINHGKVQNMTVTEINERSGYHLPVK